MVAVAADKEARTRLLRRMAVDAGFALTPSDAGKLIRPSVHDIDLSRAYFVLADLYSFRESPPSPHNAFSSWLPVELPLWWVPVACPPSSSPFVWPFIPNRYFSISPTARRGHSVALFFKKNVFLLCDNKNIIYICNVIRQRDLMNDDNELKARIEEVERSLLFYLRHYHDLASRSKRMKAVIDKEIKELEDELKDLGRWVS